MVEASLVIELDDGLVQQQTDLELIIEIEKSCFILKSHLHACGGSKKECSRCLLTLTP